jgi:lipoprotein LprG
MTAHPLPRLLGLALLPALLLVTSACGGGDATDAQDPADALAAAKTALDKTPGVHLSLTTDELPEGVDGVVKADGVGTHDPAFKGDIKVLVNRLTVDVPVVAVGGVVYAKLPFTARYAEIDPGDYGAPDPAGLIATDGGVSDWLTAATHVEAGGRVRDGDEVLATYTGVLPGDAVASVIPSADDTATFDAEFQLDDQGRLRRSDVSGPFYGDQGTVDYRITLSDYGTEQDITEP